MKNDHSMKCLLAVAVNEAVHLALVDSVMPPDDRLPTPDERESMLNDVHAIPREWLAMMSPEALAQNVCCRLLGYGGWEVGGIYAGNATPRQVFEASIGRPDRDKLAEFAFDLVRSGIAEVGDDGMLVLVCPECKGDGCDKCQEQA